MTDPSSIDLVCLGCGGVFGGGAATSGSGRCACPPPAPDARGAERAAASPYRIVADAPACPRCDAALRDAPLGDVEGLGCAACGGIFLDRRTTELLGEESANGRHRRLAFPRGDAPAPETAVRYLACPICRQRMNRQAFLGGSGVVVDVCKDHGVWFDRGELGAVVTFVEGGGLQRFRRRKAIARAESERAARGEALARELHQRSGSGWGADAGTGSMADVFGDLW